MHRVRPWFVSTGILFLLWSFLFSFPVRAQEIAMADQQEVIEAPDVVVSATKTDMPAKYVTSAVDVITGEDMQQRKIRTVGEALRWAPGL
ncbi:MAG: Vitamin B12 transporter BtuB, partial [Nitrospira sp.]|nr:Vitamin B12 transporter BtuB [Nitrospira sp.]